MEIASATKEEAIVSVEQQNGALKIGGKAITPPTRRPSARPPTWPVKKSNRELTRKTALYENLAALAVP